MPAYADLSEWQARRRELREQILSSAELLPMPEKPPLSAEVFGMVEWGDHTTEKVLLEIFPGY